MSTIGITHTAVPGKDVCDNRVHKVRLVPDKGETGVCQRKTCRTFSIRGPGKDVCDNRVHKVRLVPDKGETGVCQRKTCRTFSIRGPGKDVCDNRVHKVDGSTSRSRQGRDRGLPEENLSDVLNTCAW